MAMLINIKTPFPSSAYTHCITRREEQRGVVLIVALIMLAIISLMAATTIKGSGSSEALSNNSRTQSLALQAADAAIRYCEEGVQNALIAGRAAEAARANSLYITISVTPENFVAGTNLNWTNLTTWDTGPKSALIYKLPTSFLSTNIYKRMPECMAQYQHDTATGTQVVITARGFGPEVSDVPDATIDRKPTGSEVWLQSYLSFE
jgi:Tfp pilus assembly protein PilX